MIKNIFKRKSNKKENTELLKDKIDIMYNLSVFNYRIPLIVLYWISLFFFVSSVMCVFPLYVLGIDLIVVKILALSTPIVIGPILIIIHNILFGKKSVTLCMYCRRVKWANKYHVIEKFVGSISHGICPQCTEMSMGVIEKQRREGRINT